MSKYRIIYSLYRGDEEIAFGTIKEISEKLNIKENSLRYYKTPAYRRRVKHPDSLILVKSGNIND